MFQWIGIMKWNLKRLGCLIFGCWIIVILVEIFGFNHQVWLNQDTMEPVSANKYYGSGIDWEGGNEYFVTNPADALIYFREFNGEVTNMYLGLTRVSYAKSEYELLISTIDGNGSTITFSHVLDYDDPTTFYVDFKMGDIHEVIINIKDMDESRIDDTGIMFNVVKPFLFSYKRVVKIGMVMTMILGLVYIQMDHKRSKVCTQSM